MQSFSGHIVDGLHNQTIQLYGEGLVNFVENHIDKPHHLGGGTEGGLYLPFSDGVLDLERHAAGEEFGICLGLVKHVGIVRSSVCQLPRLVLSGIRHLAGNLFQNSSVLPAVHQH